MARWTPFTFDARTSWRLQQAKSGGGIFIGRGSHLIDASLFVLGFPRVRSIVATMHRELTGGEVDDVASAMLRLDGGCALNVQCSYVTYAAAFADRMEYEIYATEGGASFGPDGVSVGRTSMADGAWMPLGVGDVPAGPASIVDDFLDAIAEQRNALVTGEQAATITRILEAGYESAATGREVELCRFR